MSLFIVGLADMRASLVYTNIAVSCDTSLVRGRTAIKGSKGHGSGSHNRYMRACILAGLKCTSMVLKASKDAPQGDPSATSCTAPEQPLLPSPRSCFSHLAFA